MQKMMRMKMKMTKTKTRMKKWIKLYVRGRRIWTRIPGGYFFVDLIRCSIQNAS